MLGMHSRLWASISRSLQPNRAGRYDASSGLHPAEAAIPPALAPPPHKSLPMRHHAWQLRTIGTLVALGGLLVATEPAEAQKCLHPGFKVELLFQPPDVEHPSVVACDDDGNLFIGEDPMDMRGPTTKDSGR